MSEAEARLHVVVRGWVQGVGYRYFVLCRAREAGLRGWVRNRPDGSVECLAEGPRPALQRLLDELREAPRPADVSEVLADWQPPAGDLGEFSVA
ncbi:MAG TPA: acylphosphatase [Candidatus Dormibacteraeota bacterium]|nr:acylphosphatase [Candidatus Dormibacteraeota bacterium]